MSTTLNKLEYLDETKKEIKNALNTNFNSGITDEDTFRSYVGKINNIYTNWTKVTGEGTEITLNNTKKGKMALTPKGNTEQTTYTGKNLFDKSSVTSVINGSISNQIITSDETSATNYTVYPYFSNISLSSGTYYLSMDIRIKTGTGTFNKINDAVIEWTEVSKPTISSNFQRYVYSHTYTENTNLNHILIQFINSTNAIYEIKNIMLSTSSDTTYEPYVGGTLSPNPDYPQDVRVVTGNNSVKVVGKNLFDNVYIQTENVYTTHINANNPLGSVDCCPINLLPNTQYTLKVDMNGYQKTSTWIAGMCFANGDIISLLQLGSIEDITTTTFTTDSTGVVYVGQRFGFAYGEIGRMYLFLQTAKIQIEKGSTATTYEPYQSQTYPINLGTMELCKIGSYQDYIYKENGKWYKYGAIRKYTTGVSAAILSNGVYRIKLKETSNLHDMTSSTNVYVPSLSKNAIILNQSGYSAPRYNRGWGGLAIAYSEEVSSQIGEFETTQQLLNWFDNNEKVYISINPTYDDIDITEITDTTLISQLNAIENAVSYDTQTNISSEYVENNAQMIISASALEKGGI